MINESEFRIRQQSFQTESSLLTAYRASETIDSATWDQDYNNLIEEMSFSVQYDQMDEELHQLGFSPTPIEVYCFARDKKICQESALPAITALKGDYNYRIARDIAIIRTITEPTPYVQSVLNGVAMWGIHENNTVAGFAVGTNALLTLSSNIATNKVGILLKQLLLNTFDAIAENPRLFSRKLQESHFSVAEQRTISTIASGLYTAELNQIYTHDVEKWAGMVTKSLVFTLLNNMEAAGFLVLATAVSEKVGKKLYHEANVIRKLGYKIADSSKSMPFMQKMDKQHLGMVTKTNSLSKADQALLAASLIFHLNNEYGAFLYGLSNPLSSLLSQQRQMMAAEDNVRIAKKSIEFINSNDLLLKPPSWKKYGDKHGREPLENPPIANGVVIHYEVPLSKLKPSKIEPIDIVLSGGQIGFITGKNGMGKSNLFSGIKQIVRPTINSSMYFVSQNEDGKSIGRNVTSFSSAEEANTCIASIPQRLDENLSLIDHLKMDYNKLNRYSDRKFTEEILEKAWQAAISGEDATVKFSLRDEYASLYEVNEPLRDSIRNYLSGRDNFVLQALQKYVVFTGKTGTEPLSELSGGERKLFELLKLQLYVEANPSVQLVLLDEPDSGIDKDERDGASTFDDLMNVIRTIANIERTGPKGESVPPPVILITTHDKTKFDAKRGTLDYVEIPIIEKGFKNNVIFSAKHI